MRSEGNLDEAVSTTLNNQIVSVDEEQQENENLKSNNDNNKDNKFPSETPQFLNNSKPQRKVKIIYSIFFIYIFLQIIRRGGDTISSVNNDNNNNEEINLDKSLSSAFFNNLRSSSISIEANNEKSVMILLLNYNYTIVIGNSNN